jgi:endogenous inhibitor of DNA gyrase (YacG/DUF329 family)
VARQLTCPTCERPIQWSDAFPFRPFCSERCRLIDLGAWLSEKRAIPGDANEDAASPAAETDRPPPGEEPRRE